MEKMLLLNTLSDFATSYIKANFTQVTDATTIAGDSYAFNDTVKAFRLNNATTKKGAIEVSLGNVAIGDTVEISAEVRNISGVKAKIAIDYTDGSNLFILQSEKTGVFEKIGGKFVITKNSSAKAVMGVFTGEVGDYYIRNLQIKIRTEAKTAVKTTREYTFTFVTGSPLLQTNYVDDTCTVTVDATLDEMTLTHDKPFTYKIGAPIGSFSSNGQSYLLICYGTSASGFKMKIYDTVSNAYIDPSTLNNVWFSVVHHGYDLV